MKRKSLSEHPLYEQAMKRRKASPNVKYGVTSSGMVFKRRSGYSTVARTRGVYGQGEMKYFETEKAVTAVSASADWTGTEYDPTGDGLFFPQVGSAINQRIGKACKVHAIKIRGFLRIPRVDAPAQSMDACVFRLLLVQDFQTNGTQAQGEQVMTDPTENTASAACLQWQNINNFGRFKVLKDKTVVLQNPNQANTTGTEDTQGLIRPFKIIYKFKAPVEVRFNATNGGTIADVVDNSWHVMCNVSNSTYAPTINYMCRICFKE